MPNPYQSAVQFSADAVIRHFLIPVGVVMILGTIVFGLLERAKPQRRRKKR